MALNILLKDDKVIIVEETEEVLILDKVEGYHHWLLVSYDNVDCVLFANSDVHSNKTFIDHYNNNIDKLSLR